ncbi:hypothetical protein VLK31_34290 [Variovorax sp. H27-G14]|uniref:hypothetical protein n=1 Tax=Variovorax sp. H27-G14 TaxID=3111914 RepID=UPI0038FD313A
MKDKIWLEKLKAKFAASAIYSDDFYDLLNEAVIDKRISFAGILFDAAKGHGCRVSEGFFYSLDQDWDNPSEFDGVAFFIGDIESSVMPVKDYLALIKIAAEVYLESFPEEMKRIFDSLEEIEKRYS